MVFFVIRLSSPFLPVHSPDCICIFEELLHVHLDSASVTSAHQGTVVPVAAGIDGVHIT